MGRLVFYGNGGMGREMVQAAREDRRSRAFMSDGPEIDYLDIPHISFEELQENDEICLSVGSSVARRKLAARCQGRHFATVIAPTAIIDPTAEIAEGAAICDFSMINSMVKIGRHFQCNYYSHVSHDCVIGDFVTFSPRTSCLGTAHIGDGVFVGAGAVIRNGSSSRPITIGEGAVIGMGAVVTKNVPAGATVIGNPARPLQGS